MTITSYTPTSTLQSVAVAELLPMVSHGDRERGRKSSAATVGSSPQPCTCLAYRASTPSTPSRQPGYDWPKTPTASGDPKRLAGWLASTARRECFHILRQAAHITSCFDPVNLIDPSTDTERRAIDADTTRTVWTVVEQLSPRQQVVLRALFIDHPHPHPHPHPHTDITRTTRIPQGAIGPT